MFAQRRLSITSHDEDDGQSLCGFTREYQTGACNNVKIQAAYANARHDDKRDKLVTVYRVGNYTFKVAADHGEKKPKLKHVFTRGFCDTHDGGGERTRDTSSTTAGK